MSGTAFSLDCHIVFEQHVHCACTFKCVQGAYLYTCVSVCACMCVCLYVRVVCMCSVFVCICVHAVRDVGDCIVGVEVHICVIVLFCTGSIVCWDVLRQWRAFCNYVKMSVNL